MSRLAPKELHPMVLEQSESNPTVDRKPTAPAEEGAQRGRVSQDLAAGLFLIAFASIAGWQASRLSVGSARQVGAGLLPSALALLTGLSGLWLVLRSRRTRGGEVLGRWGLKGPLFVLGAAVFFGLTIRSIGLLVAGPGVVLIAVLASPDRRWREAIIFALSMTAFCALLFKLLLRLPIPLLPGLLGY
jgi:putative tricarboxylic transport membrane protein